MALCDLSGTRCETGDAFSPRPPDNDNQELMTGCRFTPAELMQWLRRERRRLCREAALDARLWTCPKHRRDWIFTLGLEELVLRQCYGIWRA